MKWVLAASAAVIIGMAASCGGDDSAPVPRRRAFPRPALFDTVMIVADSLPVRFEVNASATTARPRPDWLDIVYAPYGATVHTSFTTVGSPAELETVKANRMERLLLNAGDHTGRRMEFVNPGGFDVMVVATGGTTPVQFLATDNATIVVSGAAYFADRRAAEASDSIAPYVKAIYNDIMRSMRTLRHHD